MTFPELESNRRVALVNESFVRKFWPEQEPLGKQIQGYEIIGVVQDARSFRFDLAPEPTLFRSARKERLLHAKLLIQTHADSVNSIVSVRAALARINPKLLDGDIVTMRDTMKRTLGVQLTALRILGILGGLALLLTAIGTYGLVAYFVTRRTGEIGVRLAVGATRGNILAMVLCTGLLLGLAAVAIGIPLSLALAGVLRHHLDGVSPFDPVSFAVVTVLILITSTIAGAVPAWRASRTDPINALRAE